jgi:hypothetical protein
MSEVLKGLKYLAQPPMQKSWKPENDGKTSTYHPGNAFYFFDDHHCESLSFKTQCRNANLAMKNPSL